MKDLRRAIVKKVGKRVWVHSDGRTFSAALSEEKKKRGNAAQAESDGVLRSPMPGKILKINAAPDQAVKLGETVCVLEAMKMEYALKSPFDGKIKAVHKKAGDLVGLEEKIVEVVK